jgi:hypothetical protein
MSEYAISIVPSVAVELPDSRWKKPGVASEGIGALAGALAGPFHTWWIDHAIW